MGPCRIRIDGPRFTRAVLAPYGGHTVKSGNKGIACRRSAHGHQHQRPNSGNSEHHSQDPQGQARSRVSALGIPQLGV